MRSPARWGTEVGLTELFGPLADIQCATPQYFNFRYNSPERFVDIFRTFYGPMNKAFAALGGNPAAVAAFHSDLMTLLEQGNCAEDGTLVLPSEYLEVIVTKR